MCHLREGIPGLSGRGGGQVVELNTMHSQHPLQQVGHSPLVTTGVVRPDCSSSFSHGISTSIRSRNYSRRVLRFLLSYSRSAKLLSILLSISVDLLTDSSHSCHPKPHKSCSEVSWIFKTTLSTRDCNQLSINSMEAVEKVRKNGHFPVNVQTDCQGSVSTASPCTAK